MAVYTSLSRPDLERWLSRLPVGRLIAFEGIASGIENTNYFVDTEAVKPGPVDDPAKGNIPAQADSQAKGDRRGNDHRRRYVLTVFERLTAAQLPFYLELMQHLAARGIPCPNPVAAHDGSLFAPLANKPAALVTRLPGRDLSAPEAQHCRQVGALLARMHLATQDFAREQPNLRGLAWWQEAAPRVLPHLEAAQAELLGTELAQQTRFSLTPVAAALPAGAVHADLFRDNVLFEGDTLGGVIDFYFAGCDRWLFDLAVTCNDWCIEDDTGALHADRLAALVSAYASVRPFAEAEHEAWPWMLRAAALRFWLSRLDDWVRPRPAQVLSPKDPTQLERILRQRRESVPPLSALSGLSTPVGPCASELAACR